jgi:hypothetical protein
MNPRRVTINSQWDVLLFGYSYIWTSRQRRGRSANKSYKTLDCGNCVVSGKVVILCRKFCRLGLVSLTDLQAICYIVKCVLQFGLVSLVTVHKFIPMKLFLLTSQNEIVHTASQYKQPGMTWRWQPYGIQHGVVSLKQTNDSEVHTVSIIRVVSKPRTKERVKI